MAALYKPYLVHSAAPTPDSLTAISAHATVALRRAIRAEKACQRRERGICNMDSDIIVDGQDWDVSEFELKALPAHDDRMSVVATFVSGSQTSVTYLFAREQGEWRIDDIEAQRPGQNGLGQVTRLRAILAR